MSEMSRSNPAPLGLFQATGIELEYMIVDSETLNVLPICDRVLREVAGETVLETDRGATAWSNELALHVIETKTNGPAADLAPYDAHFQADIVAINEILAPHGGMLLPTGMHPWMDPIKESHLWPHEQGEIYQQFDRIFNCKGHGWTNLQSVHINLPFASDAEFRKLHRAIRLLLPILPALSASSPMVHGELNGTLDNRLRFYENNCRRVPQVTGVVIPEDAVSAQAYEQQILRPMYQAIKPYDPHGILAHEWLNARGAIARFDRDAIEIRILDTQEFPGADLVISTLIRDTLQGIIAGRWSDLERTASWEAEELAKIYHKVVTHAEQGYIEDEDYLGFFDFPGTKAMAGELWQHLVETADFARADLYSVFLQRGSLATRIKQAFKSKKPPREEVRELYRELANCLQHGRYFKT